MLTWLSNDILLSRVTPKILTVFSTELVHRLYMLVIYSKMVKDNDNFIVLSGNMLNWSNNVAVIGKINDIIFKPLNIIMLPLS